MTLVDLVSYIQQYEAQTLGCPPECTMLEEWRTSASQKPNACAISGRFMYCPACGEMLGMFEQTVESLRNQGIFAVNVPDESE